MIYLMKKEKKKKKVWKKINGTNISKERIIQD